MNKPIKWGIFLAAPLIAAVVAIALLWPTGEEPQPEQIPISADAFHTLTVPLVTEPKALEQVTSPETLPEADGRKPEQSEPVSQTIPQNTTPPATQTPAAPAAPPSPTQPAPTVPPPTEPQFLSLPYEIPGSDLVVTRYNSFGGIFLEDGSDRPVTNIAALMVENRGAQGVEYAELLLTLESGTTLKFEITTLPAGSTLIAQETKAQTWEDSRILSCSAQTALLETFPMSSDRVLVKELSDGVLSVTNLTNQTIPAVRVFYKFYMGDVNGYIGGITYTAKVTDLAPGATQNIDASHYIAGFSAVVMVRTYDSPE